jgi:hypothetical protein
MSLFFVLRLLGTANIVPSSLIIVTLMTEAIVSSETSVLKRAKRPTNTGFEVFTAVTMKNTVF